MTFWSFVFVGNACLDVLLPLGQFPVEDRKHTLSRPVSRQAGGNAANSSVVAAQLPGTHTVHLIAASTDPQHDSDAAALHSELSRLPKLKPHLVPLAKKGLPTSYVIITRDGSRTILHSRNLEELGVESIRKGLKEVVPYFAEPTTNKQHSCPTWVHFESRTVEPTARMLSDLTNERKAHRREVFSSVEIERPRVTGEVADLIPLADVVVLARDYVVHHQKIDSQDKALSALESKVKDNALLVLPWGAQGASASLKLKLPSGKVVFLRANVAATDLSEGVVITLGAGDTFNAALCFACAHSRCMRSLWMGSQVNEVELERAVMLVLEFANLIAGLKCSQATFDLVNAFSKAEAKIVSLVRELERNSQAAL